jgi:hypothetical protein
MTCQGTVVVRNRQPHTRNNINLVGATRLDSRVARMPVATDLFASVPTSFSSVGLSVALSLALTCATIPGIGGGRHSKEVISEQVNASESSILEGRVWEVRFEARRYDKGEV